MLSQVLALNTPTEGAQLHMIGPELETFTYEYMPESFFERLLRAVFTAHITAWEEVRARLAMTEVENVLPYYRRGKLEGYMRDAADMVTGVAAKVERAERSPWNHTELAAGPVILTASTVQEPCGPVDPADFRVALAADSIARHTGQLPLPGLGVEEEAAEDAEDEHLYVLLLHSRSRWPSTAEFARYGGLPGSAYIAFPRPGLKDYAHSVNLFAKFPHVVDALTPQEWDSEAKLRYVQRARRMAL